MSVLETTETDDQKYQEWVAGRDERIAERKARRLGSLAAKLESHAPQNPQTIIEEAMNHERQVHVEEASDLIKKTGDFLSGLDELLQAS
jgi:hypothetical protein